MSERERIVVSFRFAGSQEEDVLSSYLPRALWMKKRAEARGATLCAWSGLSFSFGFSPDDFEEALGLAALVLGPELDAAEFGVGVADGRMQLIGEGRSLEALEWGKALLVSMALAEEAGRGEVRLAKSLLERKEEDLGAHGYGHRETRLIRLDQQACRSVDPPPRQDGARGAAAANDEDLDTVEADRADPPAQARTAADSFSASVKEALLQGDPAGLERVLSELRGIGGSPDLIERVSGFIALQRGATLDGLRTLRAAIEGPLSLTQQARARLAYGVALANAGRADDALLEALNALARAREAGDSQGEQACELFLARLSAAAGHLDAASVWARAAARTQSG